MSSDFGNGKNKSCSSATVRPRFLVESPGTTWFGGVGVEKIDGRVSRRSCSQATAAASQLTRIQIPQSPSTTLSRTKFLSFTLLPSLNREWTRFPRSRTVDLENFELRPRHTVSKPWYRIGNQTPLSITHYPPSVDGKGGDNDGGFEVSRERKRDRLKTLPSKLVRKTNT